MSSPPTTSSMSELPSGTPFVQSRRPGRMQRTLSSQIPVPRSPRRDERLGGPRSEAPFRERVQAGPASVLWLALALCALANFAHGQQVDFGLSGSTLWSNSPLTSSQAYVPPAES